MIYQLVADKTSNLAGMWLPYIILWTTESMGCTTELLVAASKSVILSTFVQSTVQVLDVGFGY